MAFIPVVVNIGGYYWRTVSPNETWAGPTYPRAYVEACGGNPVLVRGVYDNSGPRDDKESDN